MTWKGAFKRWAVFYSSWAIATIVVGLVLAALGYTESLVSRVLVCLAVLLVLSALVMLALALRERWLGKVSLENRTRHHFLKARVWHEGDEDS